MGGKKPCHTPHPRNALRKVQGGALSSLVRAGVCVLCACVWGAGAHTLTALQRAQRSHLLRVSPETMRAGCDGEVEIKRNTVR